MRVGLDARLAGLQRNAGIARYTEELARSLLASSEEIGLVLVCREVPLGLSGSPRCSLARCDIPHYSLHEQALLPGILRRQRLDLVHFPNFNRPLFCSIPCVITLHDLTLMRHPARLKKRLLHKLAYRVVLTRSCRSACRIIVPSHHVRQEALSVLGVPQDKIRIVPYGLGCPFRVIEEKAPVLEVCHRFGIQPGFLLYVGQWRKHKNLVGLLNAYRILLVSSPRTPDLVLVGGDRDDQAHAYVHEELARLEIESRVRMLGFVEDEDLSRLYNAAGLYVCPSLSEGGGLSLLEAMASGLPVAASRSTAIPEYVGDAALLFDPQDLQSIAGAIQEILIREDLRQELRARGLVMARQFSWEKSALATLQVYREALCWRP